MLFPFLGGIIVAIWLNPTTAVPFWALASGTTLLFLVNIFPAFPGTYKIRWMIGLLINLAVFLFGLEFTRLQIISNSKEDIRYNVEGWLIGEVTDQVSIKGNISKTVISIRYIHEDGKWSPISRRSILNLKMNRSSVPIQFGDFMLLNARFQEVTDNSNPYSFNYARYLKNRGVFYTTWVDANAWKLLNINTTNPVRKLAFKLRGRLLDMLRENEIEGNEFAVSAALLLGYVDELTADLRNSYSATGVTHILSVSGMHVGIIFLFLEFVLGFLNKNRLGRLIKTMIMLVLIWFYAFLTGLSPAVLRAAAMLSFIIVGKSLKRSPEIFNILAASLFFLLVYNPLLILDIGFQLSYLAVTGIVLLFQPVSDIIRTGNPLTDKIWSLISMSLAAQLATTPLSLFYFHQFPNYFLITNLFVVPFSSLIIYFGIITVTLGTVPVLSLLSAKILSWLVWLLNFFIQFMEKLPVSTSRGIFLSYWEILLLYMIIGSGCAFFFMKRRYCLYLFLTGLILINCSSLLRRISRLNNARITIYNFRNVSAYEFTDKDKVFLWYDFSRLYGFRNNLRRSFLVFENNWNEARIRKKLTIWMGNPAGKSTNKILNNQIYQKNCFFQFHGKRIRVLKEKIPENLKTKISLDYLIITHDAQVSIREALIVFKPGKLIIDGMNSGFRTRLLTEEAEALGMTYHSVSQDGAFIVEL